MSPSVFAIGLFLAFVGVVWAAMVLWGLICPTVTSASERPKKAQFPPVVSENPAVTHDTRENLPRIVMPEAPAVAAVELPDDDKVVSLSQWRARRERAS